MGLTIDRNTNFYYYHKLANAYKIDYNQWLHTLSKCATIAANELTGISFGGVWEDDAATKFEGFLDNSLKPATRALDPASGTTIVVSNAISGLEKALQDCVDKRVEIADWTDYKDQLPATVKQEDWHGNNSVTREVTNPKIAQYQAKIDSLYTELDQYIANANAYISTLEGATFDPDVGTKDGGVTPNGPIPGTMEWDAIHGTDTSGDGETIRKGDTVVVPDQNGDQKVLLYEGTTPNGTNIYSDPDVGAVYVQMPGGDLTPTSITAGGLQGEFYLNGVGSVDIGNLSTEMKLDSSNPQCTKVGTNENDRRASQRDPSTYSDATRGPLPGTEEWDAIHGTNTATPSQSSPTDLYNEAQEEKFASKNGGTAGETVTITYNDTVSIGDRAGKYVATLPDGTNLYRDPQTSMIFYQNTDGSVHDTKGDEEAFKTGAGVVVNGEVVSAGNGESRTRTYEEGDEPFTYVASGGQDPSNFDTYIPG